MLLRSREKSRAYREEDRVVKEREKGATHEARDGEAGGGGGSILRSPRSFARSTSEIMSPPLNGECRRSILSVLFWIGRVGRINDLEWQPSTIGRHRSFLRADHYESLRRYIRYFVLLFWLSTKFSIQMHENYTRPGIGDADDLVDPEITWKKHLRDYIREIFARCIAHNNNIARTVRVCSFTKIKTRW